MQDNVGEGAGLLTTPSLRDNEALAIQVLSQLGGSRSSGGEIPERVTGYVEQLSGADFSRATKPYFYEPVVTSPDQIPSGSRSVQHYRTVAVQPLQTPSFQIP